MSTVAEIIPRVEGTIGQAAGASQAVAEWVEGIKRVLRLPENRSKTDWEFVSLTDIDEDGATETNAAPLTTMGYIVGLLVGDVSTAAEVDWVVVADGDTLTFSGTAALDNAVTAVVQIPLATTAIPEQFVGSVWPTGIVHATGCTVAADGRDGTNPATSDIRGWIVGRSNL